MMIFRFSDTDKALALLQANGLKVADAEALKKL